MVYLSHFTHEYKKAEPILTGTRREQTVAKLMEILDDWRWSPFEGEGTTKHGLREALCLNGQPWPLADFEAGSLVDTALRLNGAVRPTWSEGQSHHATSPDYCSVCTRQLSAAQVAAGYRYCGEKCAKVAIVDRQYEAGWEKDAMGRRAYDIIRRSRTIPRSCQQCGGEFRVVHESRSNKFCSKPCRNESLKTRLQRACEHCDKMFLPSNVKINKFCSHPCFIAAGRKRTFLKTCQCCQVAFIGKSDQAMYCSGKCNAKAHYHRKRGTPVPQAVILRFPTLSPEVFDELFVPVAKPPVRRPTPVKRVEPTLAGPKRSPFVNQGGTVHALRVSLIAKGRSWADAQAEAEKLVSEALWREGVEKPQPNCYTRHRGTLL